MAWIRLIRWYNLLIIFLTQVLAWVCLFLPLYLSGKSYIIGVKNFLFLSFSTILIAAAGYIINDYFDIRIDTINKPGKLVLEKLIPRKQAIISHSVLNIIALIMAGYVAGPAGHYEWLLFQLCCTLSLWFYSTYFKRMFMIGNIVVSLLSAFTIIVLILYEPALHEYFNKPVLVSTEWAGSFLNPVWMAMGYCFFAFIITWMREIVKDMEDFIGDEKEGCKTMPIKWGIRGAEKFVHLLGIITLTALLASSYFLWQLSNRILSLYIVIAIAAPLVMWMVYLTKKKSGGHYHKASQRLKFIMVAGIISLVIYFIQVHAQTGI